MDVVKIVNKINKEHGTIKNVYFLACGGSLVDLYPGYYFVRAESAVMDAQWIPAREFALTPPKKLGKDSLLIICSHSGKTKECLEAAKTGMDAGAAVVTMTHAPGSPCDTDKWISVVYDWAPGVKEAEKPQGIVLRILNELMKVQEPGYKLYDKIVEGFEKIDDVIATAVKDQQSMAFCRKIFRGTEPLYHGIGSFLFSGIWLCDLLTSGNAVDGLRLSEQCGIFSWTV